MYGQVAFSVFPNIADKKSLCQAFFAVTPINSGYGVPDGRKASLDAPRRPPHRYGSCSRSGAAACRACCAKPPCFADEQQTWPMLVSAMRSYENSAMPNRFICSRQGGLNASRPSGPRAVSARTCSPTTLRVHCDTVLLYGRQAFQQLLSKCVPERESTVRPRDFAVLVLRQVDEQRNVVSDAKVLRTLRSARCDRFN